MGLVASFLRLLKGIGNTELEFLPNGVMMPDSHPLRLDNFFTSRNCTEIVLIMMRFCGGSFLRRSNQPYWSGLDQKLSAR